MAAGGARPGAGRPKGSRSAATKEQQATISDLAKALAPQALDALRSVMTSGASESARVAAANSILDRAYGRPKDVEPDDKDEPKSLTINISTAAPVSDVRVTRHNS